MAIHDPRTPGTSNYIEISNSDGSLAQACGNGMLDPGEHVLVVHSRILRNER